MLSFKDKILIKYLWECERFSTRRFTEEFPSNQELEKTNIRRPSPKVTNQFD